MANFTAGTTFTDGVTNDVTAAKLNALVADAVPTSNLSLNSTTGTISNFTASTANITLGTIPTLTAGTTTSTAATITTGTIPTLTAGTTTSTAATITSATITTGTIPTLVATTLVTTGTGTAAAPAIVPTGDTNTGLFFPAADTIAASSGGTERVRIDSSGNVGIGATPSAKLHIFNNATAAANNEVLRLSYNTSTTAGHSGDINFTNSGGLALGRISSVIQDGSNVGMAISTYSGSLAERLRIDSSGNVGVGTASPSDKLHISSASQTFARVDHTSSSSYAGFTIYESSTQKASILATGTTGTSLVGGANALQVWNYRSGNIVFGTDGTERLRIDSSGNVGIGNTNPSNADHKLVIDHSNPTSGGGGISINQLVSGTGRAIQFVYQTNTQVGSITTTNSATAFNTSSDYRLKINLEPISDGITRLKQLPVYRFNWLADIDGDKVDGFVAHEAQAIVPECVTGEKDAVDADGKPIYQGIDQSKIVPLLTAALKEAITKIETLEAKVAALEAA